METLIDDFKLMKNLYIKSFINLGKGVNNKLTFNYQFRSSNSIPANSKRKTPTVDKNIKNVVGTCCPALGDAFSRIDRYI